MRRENEPQEVDGQLKVLEAKKQSFEKSQNDLDKKFNQLLETIKSQG